MYTEKQDIIKEHVIDVTNAICAKSKQPDSTSILGNINKIFAANADEIYVNDIQCFIRPEQNSKQTYIKE